MKLNLNEIIKATNAKLLKGVENQSLQNEFDTEYVFGFSTDTRTIKPDEIYIPLKGENFDGENFIVQAVNSGAKGYFTSDKSKIIEPAEIVLFTEDTREAYLKLASYYKNKINPFTIAITGSSGKTTVKEMMYSVFNIAGKTVKSLLNHNNEIGLCQTLSSLDFDTKYLITEMGMRGFGEIDLLSKYARPDIAVIVNAGSAHIGRLGSKLNIAKAKFEITHYLNPKGILIAHDNPLIREINDNKHRTIYFGINDKDLQIKEMTREGNRFLYKGSEYCLNVTGEHNIENALSVIEAGLNAGLNPALIARGLKEYKPIENRWNIKKINGYNVINDCYNSNPDSVKAAIKTFLSLTPSPKVLVLGDMGELGEQETEYHKKTGEFIDNFDCDCVITTGELAKNINPLKIKTLHCNSKKEVSDFIKGNFEKGTNILIKASRFMKFEEIIEELEK